MSAEVSAFRSVCWQLIYVVAFKSDLAGDRNESKPQRDYHLAQSSNKLFFLLPFYPIMFIRLVGFQDSLWIAFRITTVPGNFDIASPSVARQGGG